MLCAVVIRPSLDSEKIIWTTVVRANMDNCDAQDGCSPVLQGKACTNGYDRKTKQVAAAASNIRNANIGVQTCILAFFSCLSIQSGNKSQDKLGVVFHCIEGFIPT